MAYEVLKRVGKAPAKNTPQTKKAAPGQKRNDAGGFTFTVDKMERIKRFLILGSESSFYRAGESLTLKRVKDIEDVAQSKGAFELIDLIVAVSTEGRAPKQDPGVFALALTIASATDDAVKTYAYSKVSEVCRTATTLFMFAGFLRQLQGSGFGMGARKAFKRWYEDRPVESLAFQIVKYPEREGWTHKDLISLARPTKSKTDEAFSDVMNYVLKGEPTEGAHVPSVITGKELAKRATGDREIVSLVTKYGLSWEMLPSESLNSAKVWEALLGNIPLGALIRQLPRLTRIGVIRELGGSTQAIVDRLTDQEALRKARIHPMNLLIAAKTYAVGRSLQNFRSSDTWTPNPRILSALDKAFYLSFGNVKPTGKRFLNGVDTSGSMSSRIAGQPALSAAEAAAALALVTANVEDEVFTVGFDTDVYPTVDIRRGMDLPTALRNSALRTGRGTDTAGPIRWARLHKIEVDVFQLMTDNETWAGPAHTHQELAAYRREMGINAKLVVLATNASRSSVADPKDPLSLDVVGFDASVPQVISTFVAD